MDTLEIIGAVIGICYFILEYRASIWLWPVGILMPLAYIFIFYQNGFYANMGINVYYLAAGVFGWLKWKKSEKSNQENSIVHIPCKWIGPYLLCVGVLFFGIAQLLLRVTDSEVPYGDALIASLSILGMWMMAHKQIEQWFVWIVVNVVSSLIYIQSGMYPTGLFYLIYSVVSVFGYLNWKKMMIAENKPNGSLANESLPFFDPHRFQPDVVVVAAGDFPSSKACLKQLDDCSNHIICCDGAAEELWRRGYQPLKVVGDGDSLSDELRQQLGERFLQIEEQDDNDLTKSVRYAIQQGHRRILIMGATGKREDHTLGNISLLADYMDQAQVMMQTDYGYFVPIDQDYRIACAPRQQVSFFDMDRCPISLEQLRWPLKNQVLTRWWQATLNETLSDSFVVRTRGKVIVFLSNTSNI